MDIELGLEKNISGEVGWFMKGGKAIKGRQLRETAACVTLWRRGDDSGCQNLPKKQVGALN